VVGPVGGDERRVPSNSQSSGLSCPVNRPASHTIWSPQPGADRVGDLAEPAESRGGQLHPSAGGEDAIRVVGANPYTAAYPQ
jgi:hypothetical protein